MVEAVTLTLPPSDKIPPATSPPVVVAVLPVIVHELTVTGPPSLRMPPAASSSLEMWLPVIVHLLAETAPPSDISGAESLLTDPPAPLMVTLLTVTPLPPASSRPRPWPFRSIVTPLPSMVTDWSPAPVAVHASGLASVIVPMPPWTLMVSGPAADAAFSNAWRSDPAPESWLLVTLMVAAPTVEASGPTHHGAGRGQEHAPRRLPRADDVRSLGHPPSGRPPRLALCPEGPW